MCPVVKKVMYNKKKKRKRDIARKKNNAMTGLRLRKQVLENNE